MSIPFVHGNGETLYVEPRSYLVGLYPSFEGLGAVDRYSILLESPQCRGDKHLRHTLKVDGKKPIFWQGYLLKCSRATGKGFWKKQYVVFQNQTLMIYSSQEEFEVNLHLKIHSLSDYCTFVHDP